MKIYDAKKLLSAIVHRNIERWEHAKKKGDLDNIHQAFIIPMFVGDPGVGKTAIPKQVCAEFGINYYQAIVAQYDAGEMGGFGMPDATRTKMVRLRPDYLPPEEMPVIDEDGKVVTDNRGNPKTAPTIGIFNLDELPQAFLANQNICSQLVNEYRIGKHSVSRLISICCTGNKPENKAGTTTMPMHLRDRLDFISIEADSESWLNWAAANSIDHRVRAYVRNNPGKLHKFVVGQDANPTPRSWEKSSEILALNQEDHIRREALAGQIGAGTANEFEKWLRVEDRMPKIEDVIANPHKAPVFTTEHADVLHMLLAALADVANAKNVGQIVEYMKRLPNQEFTAFWAQDAFLRDPSLLKHPAVNSWKLKYGTKLFW